MSAYELFQSPPASDAGNPEVLFSLDMRRLRMIFASAVRSVLMTFMTALMFSMLITLDLRVFWSNIFPYVLLLVQTTTELRAFSKPGFKTVAREDPVNFKCS